MDKVVFVIDKLFGGGAERVTSVLMNEMCRYAEIHLVETISYDPNDGYPIDDRIIRHQLMHRMKGRFARIWERILYLRRTIGQIHPRCVISLGSCRVKVLMHVALMGMAYPQVMSERNDPKNTPSSHLERILRHWVYRTCDGLVFQTLDAHAYFPEMISKKSVVIGNPITGILPERNEEEKEQRIINCCRLIPQKNLDLLLDAFSDIASEFPRISLVVFGDGVERERLEMRVHEMGLTERVSFPGHTDKVYDEMRRSLMFVSSSDYEGISNSMIEAIALGVPTVCTDCPVGGARTVIRDGVNGLLVPTGDREELSKAMRRILIDPEFARRLSDEGIKIREELSAEAIAQRWWEYMIQVVEGC